MRVPKTSEQDAKGSDYCKAERVCLSQERTHCRFKVESNAQGCSRLSSGGHSVIFSGSTTLPRLKAALGIKALVESIGTLFNNLLEQPGAV